ncbi:hypothetical protein Hdeb2414_s0039g00735551 [Helianthus debilis subsp. tardiflorus]
MTMLRLVNSYMMVFCISFLVLFVFHRCGSLKIKDINASGPPPCNHYCSRSFETGKHCCCYKPYNCSKSVNDCMSGCTDSGRCCPKQI